jgi:hypothetical protein
MSRSRPVPRGSATLPRRDFMEPTAKTGDAWERSGGAGRGGRTRVAMAASRVEGAARRAPHPTITGAA